MLAKYSRAGVALMGVPLYAGPLLAGWSGAPWPVPAALAALFFLMQLVRGIDAQRAGLSPTAAVLLLALVQVVVVGSVYGIGGLLGWATHPLPLPLWVPLAVTAFGAAIGVLRYRRAPQEEEMIEALDQAIGALERGHVVDWDVEPEAEADSDAAIVEALQALETMPEDTVIDEIDTVIRRLETRVGHTAYAVLLAETGTGFRAIDLAMLRYLAIPSVRARLVDNRPGAALSRILDRGEADAIDELASLTATLLAEGAPAAALPDAALLADRARRFTVLAPLVAPVEKAHRTWNAASA